MIAYANDNDKYNDNDNDTWQDDDKDMIR